MAADVIDGELVPTSIDDRVALIRMENDTLFAAARAVPRDHKQIRSDLVAQLDAYPQLAAECIYSKPVGRDKETNEMKYATGLSVRCAEALADVYGYNRVEAETIELDADRVKVIATYTDFARVRVWRTSGILSKSYKDRNGKMQRIADDRFYSIVCKAEASRLIREAICRAVPPGLRAQIRDLCERKIAGLLSDQGVKKIADKYSELGVTVEQLETHIGRKSNKWTEADRITLGKLYNAIEQEEITVQQAFAGEPQTSDSDGATTTMDELTNPQRGDETGDQPKAAEKPKRSRKSAPPADTSDDVDAKPVAKPGRGMTREQIQQMASNCDTDEDLQKTYKQVCKFIDEDSKGFVDSVFSSRSEEIRTLQDKPGKQRQRGFEE